MGTTRPRGLDTLDRVAIAAAEIASRLQPEDAAPHDFMARLLRDRGEMGRAADHLRVSFSLMPSLSQHEWVRVEPPGAILGAAILEGIDRARTAAGRPVADIARARAEALALLGRPEEAIAAWQRVVDVADARGRAEAWLMVGKILQAQGRPGESLDPLRRASSGTTPWAADAQYFLGKAHAALGDTGEAIAAFRVFLELRPGRPLAHLALGRALINAGEYREAEEVLVRAEGMFPDEERIRRMRDQARKAREARDSGS